MKLRKSNEGVSEIVSTVLLLGMAISFFSLLCVTVLSYPSSPSSPSVNLASRICGEDPMISLIIDHCGGEALSLDTKVIVTIGDDSPVTITIRDQNYSEVDVNDDNLWGIGEQFIYTNANLAGKPVSVTVVDVESNSMVMTGTIQGS